MQKPTTKIRQSFSKVSVRYSSTKHDRAKHDIERIIKSWEWKDRVLVEMPKGKLSTAEKPYYQTDIMDKDTLLVLLRLILKDFKRRCEQTYDEYEADKWSENHKQINKIIRQIKQGGIK